jgi:hypothetical protein
LPPYGRVGYVTDATPQGGNDGEAPRLAFKRYLLTQYALVPTIVLPEYPGPLAVGNFQSPNGLTSGTQRQPTLVRDFGGGVMLLRTAAE